MPQFIQLQSNNLTVAINLLGAELTSAHTHNGTEFMWQAGNEWQRTAPVLFPIVGKLKNSTYSFQDNTYTLPQHGFARDCEFQLLSNTINTATFLLSQNATTLKNYPFKFEFLIHYLLNENQLTISYEIKNLSQTEMLFSMGAHPAFNCNLNTSYLEFENNKLLATVLSDGLLTSQKRILELDTKKLALNTALFDNDALVFENNQINSVSLCQKNSSKKVTLVSPNWPFYGIWTKKDCSKFLCLEPWFGIADTAESKGDLSTKKGILSLEIGGVFKTSYSILFED